MITFIIVVVFLVGLALFIKNLPKLRQAMKERWDQGKAESKEKKDK